MTIKSISTAPKCTALYNLLLKYLWFPYKIKVIINDLLSCVVCDSRAVQLLKNLKTGNFIFEVWC